MTAAAETPYLCIGCPGKGDYAVDLDVIGSSPIATVDSFKQTRRYRITCPEDYADNNEMAELSAGVLMYFDPEENEQYERLGDIGAALLGIACAERFLIGECTKSEREIIQESEID